MTPLFSDEPGWESGREVQGRIAARLGRMAEEERKQEIRRVLRDTGRFSRASQACAAARMS
jgi:hypothetical protein